MNLTEIADQILRAAADLNNPVVTLDQKLAANLPGWKPGYSLFKITGLYGVNIEQIFLQIVIKADAEGWLTDLLSALVQAYPKNPQLRNLLREVASTVPADEESTAELEAMLGGVTLDFGMFEDRKRAVCRVDYEGRDQPGEGTGFLVSDHAVLTNWHVARHTLDRPGMEAQLRFKFGMFADSDTPTVFRAKQRDGQSAIRDWSPAGGVEMRSGAAEPGQAYLDFALIEVEKVESEETPGPEPRPVKLDWIGDLPADNAPLLAIQHPLGGRMQFAIGKALGLTPSRARLQHKIPTQYGSSGALILDAGLKPVALHNGRRTRAADRESHHNTGVPLGLIVERLRQKGLAELAGLTA